MKKSEAILKYYGAIKEAMVGSYKEVVDSEGSIQYKIYIWEDGQVQRLLGVQGDNMELRPNEYEDRALYYVTTIELPCFDPFDYSDEGRPEDEAEREAAEKEICDWLVDEYENNADEVLDHIIEDAKFDENMEG